MLSQGFRIDWGDVRQNGLSSGCNHSGSEDVNCALRGGIRRSISVGLHCLEGENWRGRGPPHNQDNIRIVGAPKPGLGTPERH